MDIPCYIRRRVRHHEVSDATRPPRPRPTRLLHPPWPLPRRTLVTAAPARPAAPPRGQRAQLVDVLDRPRGHDLLAVGPALVAAPPREDGRAAVRRARRDRPEEHAVAAAPAAFAFSAGTAGACAPASAVPTSAFLILRSYTAAVTADSLFLFSFAADCGAS